MQRVDTLIKKLQEQFAAEATASQLLLTVQMLQAELSNLQSKDAPLQKGGVSVDFTHSSNFTPASTASEEKIVEVLQVDEAEIEAELNEIKKNAAEAQKNSSKNKPHLAFDTIDDEIPTLAHQIPSIPIKPVEINDSNANIASSSLNDRLKQTNVDLSETIKEAPITDLRKAVGVNDKFLFINDLFRGDETMYERSIKTINSFAVFQEAEYWIQRELKLKLGWNENDATVKQFTQLVKKRFS